MDTADPNSFSNRKLGFEILNLLAGLSDSKWSIADEEGLSDATLQALEILGAKGILHRRIFLSFGLTITEFADWDGELWTEIEEIWFVDVRSLFSRRMILAASRNVPACETYAPGADEEIEVEILPFTAYRISSSEEGLKSLSLLLRARNSELELEFLSLVAEWSEQVGAIDESSEDMRQEFAVSDFQSSKDFGDRLQLKESVSKVFSAQHNTAALNDKFRFLFSGHVSPIAQGVERSNDAALSSTDNAYKAEDKTKKSRPRSPELNELITRLRTGLPDGKSQIEIAREVVNGTEKEARNLLRSARRYFHLWHPDHVE